MGGDAPLLDRLAQLPAVPISSVVTIIEGFIERLDRGPVDPLIGPLFGTDEEGNPTVNPLVPAVLNHFQTTPALTCYAALLEGLTGIWNAAVRAAVVARLRASGLPSDDLLREWLADPFTQDALLVQQCIVRLLLGLRGMAEARATDLSQQTPSGG
jgi:hypothetical protein